MPDTDDVEYLTVELLAAIADGDLDARFPRCGVQIRAGLRRGFLERDPDTRRLRVTERGHNLLAGTWTWIH